MRDRLRITALLLAAALVVVLAAGCGGAKRATGPARNPGATGNGTGPTGVGPTGAGPTGGGGSSFTSAKNCLAFAGMAAKIAEVTAATSGSDPQAVERELQAFADAAPSDVKGDFETLATAFSGYLTAAEKSGYRVGSTNVPTQKQIDQLVQAAKSFNTPQVRRAETDLSAWAAANCH